MKQRNLPDADDPNMIWLHLVCCGGPLAILVLISLAPSLIAFVLTNRAWVLATGVGVVTVGALLWWRGTRRMARLSSGPKPIEPARVRQP